MPVPVTKFGTVLNMRGKLLDLERPQIMGILNLTQDSFYADSRVGQGEVVDRAGKMLEQGAAMLDLGAASSRPGAKTLLPEQELDTLLPAIEALRDAYPHALLSCDTPHAAVAERVLASGVHCINDISGGAQPGLYGDMYSIIGSYRAGYIMMHMRGTPATMQSETEYPNLLADIGSYFGEQIALANAAGVYEIVLDLGFGFSKTMAQNYTLLAQIPFFVSLGYPLLAGVSRKGMIYKPLGIDAENSLPGTVAAQTLALIGGANILRVHDVEAARQAVEVVGLYQSSLR
jgi:dihydropteroate synthase